MSAAAAVVGTVSMEVDAKKKQDGKSSLPLYTVTIQHHDAMSYYDHDKPNAASTTVFRVHGHVETVRMHLQYGDSSCGGKSMRTATRPMIDRKMLVMEFPDNVTGMFLKEVIFKHPTENREFKCHDVSSCGDYSDFSLKGYVDNGHIIMARMFYKGIPRTPRSDAMRVKIQKIWLDPALFTESDPDHYFNHDEEGEDDDFG
jgi:hypothetical protein